MAPAMADIAFYLEQAAACSRAAEETNLPRLQEMYRSAQTRWQVLATSETIKMNYVRDAVCARSVTSEASVAAAIH